MNPSDEEMFCGDADKTLYLRLHAGLSESSDTTPGVWAGAIDWTGPSKRGGDITQGVFAGAHWQRLYRTWLTPRSSLSVHFRSIRPKVGLGGKRTFRSFCRFSASPH